MTLDPRYDFQGPKWSPDGRRVVYRRSKFGSGESLIEARTLADGAITGLYAGSGLQDFWWTADGRLIYSQTGASEDTHDLWEVHIDGRTAKPSGEPRRLTRWVGYAPGLVSVSTDGKRIVTTKGYHQTDVYVAELEVDGRHLKAEKRVTQDTRFDWPSGWTGDGKEILFFSDRSGVFNVFKQNESSSNADVVISGRDNSRSPQISPDRQWLLYTVWPDEKAPGPVRVMRVSQSGGLNEEVLEAKGPFAGGVSFTVEGEQDTQKGAARSFPDFRCPSSATASCILAEADQEEISFTFFDPMHGRGSEAVRVRGQPARFFWDLSPDGSQLAYGEFKSEENDSITILKLKDSKPQPLPLSGQSNLSSLSWAAGGRGLFVTTKRREGSDLLHVRLADGHITVLREEKGRVFLSPRPSPDGRFLAYAIRTTDSNVWLLEAK